jgi:branched-chain amino acid transport system permease protein
MASNRQRTKRWRQGYGFVALFIILVALPWIITDPYMIFIFTLILINIILAGTLFPLLHTDIFSVAHAAFMAVGAYSSALLTLKLGLNFWFAFPIAGITTALFAVLVGIPTLRTKGVFFLLITLGLNEVVRLVISSLKITGGAEGLGDIGRIAPIPLPGIGAIEFTSRTANYYFILILAIIAIAIIARLWKTRFGRAWQAIGQSEELAFSLGINVVRYKLCIFCISCFFAGLTGSFFAHYYRFLSPVDFTVWHSIYPLVYLQVGGLGSIAGPVIGASILTGALEIFRAIEEYKPMTFGILLIVVMLLVPKGFIGIPSRVRVLLKGIEGKKGSVDANPAD